MPEKNALVPDVSIVTLNGETLRLWDLRQKSHLLLLAGDEASDMAIVLAGKKKLVDWLNLRVIACPAPPPGFEAGAHLIDRFGRYISYFSIDASLPGRVEKELIYYEARHC
jgi:hypothetical protein